MYKLRKFYLTYAAKKQRPEHLRDEQIPSIVRKVWNVVNGSFQGNTERNALQ